MDIKHNLPIKTNTTCKESVESVKLNFHMRDFYDSFYRKCRLCTFPVLSAIDSHLTTFRTVLVIFYKKHKTILCKSKRRRTCVDVATE